MNEGFKNKYEHVSRDSEVVLESIKKAREDIEQYEANFQFTEDSVVKTLDMLDQAEKLGELANSEEGREVIQETERIAHEYLRRAYAFFLKSISKKTFNNIIEDIKGDPGLFEELSSVSKSLFDIENISTDLIIRIFKQRLKCSKKREEELSEKWDEIMTNVFDNVQIGIDDGLIGRSTAEMETIFNKQKFKKFDPFFNDRLMDGYHNPQSETIGISSNSSLESLPHMILHEAIHSLAGRTILNTKSHEEGDIKNNVKQQRAGLIFLNNDQKTTKLQWLNEAVTEEITKELVGTESGYYRTERRKLEKLYELGIDREIIYNSYFEDYNPDDPERVPHWKKFVVELKRVFPDLSVIQALEKVSDDVDEEIKREKLKDEKIQS